MRLAAYLEREKMKPTGFARKAGVPASTITRILKGEREPMLPTIRKIEQASGGEVTAGDFAPDIEKASGVGPKPTDTQGAHA